AAALLAVRESIRQRRTGGDAFLARLLIASLVGLAGAGMGLAFATELAAGLVLDPVLRRAAVPATRGVWVTACGLAFWLTLPLSARLNLHQPIRHEGFWTPIGLEDLRALRRIEDAIPPGDGVIVPAEHARFGGWENWVLPRGETTAL